ncbi:hypothetical protein [Methanohalophilus profundi]|uniref:hypothetical protein n=1 Tax=Methanohalophilus profundi TaxID=2138083 RepID=UPI00177E8469|nr:hypothetical protein [Methanohalophilus profundi]
MENKLAVVFDSAGTLLHMYRVARDMSNGMMLEDIESTMLVAGRKGRALVVLHADMEMILESQPRGRKILIGFSRFIQYGKQTGSGL